jgi:hypothetical protein|tara:strand:- start:415 stop:966 length:552 start_codon:yes stop_codon:yes gene_type:complete
MSTKKSNEIPGLNNLGTKFRQLDEALDWVFEIDEKEDQVERLKTIAAKNQTVVPLVRLGVGADKADWGLPHGMPDSVKIKDDTPPGMGETTIALEYRRIKTFMDQQSNMKNLPAWKQEMNWMSTLEGLHFKEAHLITAIKDVQLLTIYPKLEGILSLLGITDYVKPVKAKKKRAPAKKKTATK